MWDAPIRPETAKKEALPLLEWMEKYGGSPEIQAQVEGAWKAAKQDAPKLEGLEKTPQGGPWHCEGLFVSTHVKRILSVVFAIGNGASLHEIEELAGKKHLRDEVTRMEETIREQLATFEAFALLHDIAKQETLTFDAVADSRGAVEGFVQHKHRVSPEASEEEKALYVKLVRAWGAGHPELAEGPELMTSFFDAYKIQTHYYEHPAQALTKTYAEDRLNIEKRLRLTPRDAEILAFVIRNHIDAMKLFDGSMDGARFELLSERAVRDGLDPDDVLDVLLCALFLDGSMGGISYRNGRQFADVEAVLKFLHAEELAAPARREARRREREQKQKQAFKTILKAAGLGGDEPFKLLNIPFGRERKGITLEIEHLVKDPSLPIPDRYKEKALLKRLQDARGRFDAVRATWENGNL